MSNCGHCCFQARESESIAVSKIRFTIGGFLGLFLDGIIVALPGTILPQWKIDFGANVEIWLFYNLFLLGSLIGISLAYKLRQRHPLMGLSFATIGLAFLIATRSPSFKGILVAAILIGLGDGILNLQCNSLVGELHSTRRVAVLNWANAAFGLGAISTPLLGALFSWRIIFALAASLAFISVALVWRAPSVKNFAPEGGRMLWSRASIFLLMIIFYTGLEGTIGTWSSTYLLHLGWDKTQTGKLLSLYWGGLTLGRMLLGSWVGKQPLKALSWLLIGAIGVLGLCLIPSLAILFPLAAFFYGPLFATLFALLQESCGHVALGYLFYAAFIGKTSIPAAFSIVENPNHFPYGFIFLALILYLGLELEKKSENMR